MVFIRLKILGHECRKVRVSSRREVVAPVVGDIMDPETGGVGRRGTRLGRRVGEGETVRPRGRQGRLGTARAGEGGAAAALDRDLPVSRVRMRAGLECRICSSCVWRWCYVTASQHISLGKKTFEASLQKGETYVANREEIVALLPLAQVTAKGLLTIVPPQAKPAQPTSKGATT